MSEAKRALRTATWLVDESRAAGADDAEVYLRSGPITRISHLNNSTMEAQGWHHSLALRVWVDGRVSLLTTSDFTLNHLSQLARLAVAEARQRGVSNYPWLRSEQRSQSFAVDVARPVGIEEKHALLSQLIAYGRASRSFDQKILTACYTDSVLWTVLVNSRGLSTLYQATNHRIWLWIEGASGHLSLASAGRHFDDLALTSIGRQLDACSVLLDSQIGQAPEGPCAVILPPLVAADLARSVSSMLTGENVLGSLRPLLKWMERPIAASSITLVDDGTLPMGLKSRPVDDEGTPTSRTVLVEKGRLRNFLQTLETAAELNMKPNGKATRSALWQQPRALPSNAFFEAGDVEPDELLRQLKRGILVTSTLRPGRLQSATGKFTLIAQGAWVEHGTVMHPLNGVQLSANVFELLRSVQCCGRDLQFSTLADGVGAPSMLVERMQVR
jgi:PmbA protein